MALKENYKDDILDTSQNVKRKYQMENNGDGTVSFTDVTEYTQQGDSFGSGDINATNSKVNTLDANLDGFKFYPTGTGIVGLIADDSAYTDEDGNYVVWGTETAEQLIADNPNTYKSVPSTEDTRGEVGADTAIPFSKEENPEITLNYSVSIPQGSSASIPNLVTDFDSYIAEMQIGSNSGNGELHSIVMNNNNFNVGYLYQNGGSATVPTKVKIKKMEKGLSERTVTRQFSVPGTITIASGFNQLYGIKKLTFTKEQSGWTTFTRVQISENDLILRCAHPFSSAESVTANIVFVGK